MAKSYSSYFREREKDKPYRGAELALGFLGELISSKNQQALQYDKLLLEKEKADALKDYREQTLAANIKQIDPRKGPAYQYNPETRSYDIIEGVGGAGSGVGSANYGEIYADLYKNKYLDGLIEYGDEDGDGVAALHGEARPGLLRGPRPDPGLPAVRSRRHRGVDEGAEDLRAPR